MSTRHVIGRSAEKNKMRTLLKSSEAEFLAVYGRRRVGKTFLIQQMYREHIVFEFTGTYKVRMRTQLHNFYNAFAVSFRDRIQQDVPKDWFEAFQMLSMFLDDVRIEAKKMVVFIDEMPWLDTPRSKFISALGYFWNSYASRQYNLILVACGSVTSWMQKKLFQDIGGLHNRVTARILLRPFTLSETEEYCKHKGLRINRYQIVQLYMAFGGIPFYLRECTPGKSATQMIDALCFSESGMLISEYEHLYHSLFYKAENHLKIVEDLAARPTGLTRKDIVTLSGLSDGGAVNRSIMELLQNGFITKYLPFGKKQRESLYRLTDFYSLFYLKFIKEAKSKGPGTWQSFIGKPAWYAWSGYTFENICLMHVAQIKWALGIAGIYTEHASWRHTATDELPGAQIDLIIDRNDNTINLCEAKYTEKGFITSKKYAEQLRQKAVVFKSKTKNQKDIVYHLAHHISSH